MGAKTKTTAVIAAIAAMIAAHEGLRTTAYPDPANPSIWTVCYGETQGVKRGDKYTPTQCREILEKRIPDYLGPVDKALPNLPDNRRIAYADAAYNLGAGILTRGNPSIVDLERAGKWQDACNRLRLFDRANGKQLPGLTKRRNDEADLCLGH